MVDERGMSDDETERDGPSQEGSLAWWTGVGGQQSVGKLCRKAGVECWLPDAAGQNRVWHAKLRGAAVSTNRIAISVMQPMHTAPMFSSLHAALMQLRPINKEQVLGASPLGQSIWPFLTWVRLPARYPWSAGNRGQQRRGDSIILSHLLQPVLALEAIVDEGDASAQ